MTDQTESFQELATRLKAEKEKIMSEPITADNVRRYREIKREISLAGLKEIGKIITENPPPTLPRPQVLRGLDSSGEPVWRNA